MQSYKLIRQRCFANTVLHVAAHHLSMDKLLLECRQQDSNMTCVLALCGKVLSVGMRCRLCIPDF
jgi:hypothetical protein